MPTKSLDARKLTAADVKKLKKSELLEALDQLDLEADKDATVPQLKEALTEALASPEADEDEKAEDSQEEDSKEEEAEKSPEKAEAKTGDAKSVYNASGVYIRTYSLALHGEKYAALAEQFAGKMGGTARDGAK